MKRVLTIVLILCVSYVDSFAGGEEQAKRYQISALERVSKRDYAGAVKQYDQAIRLNPDIASLYNARGKAKAKLELYESAIRDYTKALELEPNFGDCYYNRGVARYYIGYEKGALRDLQKADALGIKEAHNVIEKVAPNSLKNKSAKKHKHKKNKKKNH